MNNTLKINLKINYVSALMLSALLVGTATGHQALAVEPSLQTAPDLLTPLIVEKEVVAAETVKTEIVEPDVMESEVAQPEIASTDISQLAQQPISATNTADTLVAQTATESETPAFGQAGTQRWYLQGGYATDLDDDAFLLAGGGISHFFHDGHSVNLELNGLSVNQPGDDAQGGTLTFLVRSHWIRGQDWSLYVDGGAGILFTTDNVPAAGSSFNFTPQIGGGASFAINDDDQRIMTGLRWYHISNADTFESNPGLDTVFGYVGINFPL